MLSTTRRGMLFTLPIVGPWCTDMCPGTRMTNMSIAMYSFPNRCSRLYRKNTSMVHAAR